MNPAETDWREAAACRSAPASLFFGPDDEKPPVKAARETEARAVCSGCASRTPCLDYRLSFERQDDGGIWAALDGDERARERRRRMRRAANAARAAREAAA